MPRAKRRRTRWGRLLVLYRATHGLGVRAMAKSSGISAATISRIERGHAMDAETLLALWTWLQQPDEFLEAR